jgi:hypothetical protein
MFCRWAVALLWGGSLQQVSLPLLGFLPLLLGVLLLLCLGVLLHWRVVLLLCPGAFHFPLGVPHL